MMNNLIKILKENPNAYIYYHDKGAYYVYTSKKDFDKAYNGDGYFEKYEVYSGREEEPRRGVVPPLVEALARVGGFTIDSV